MTPKNPGHRRGPLAATAAGVLLLLTLAGCAGGPATTPDAGSAPSASASAPATPGTPSAPPPVAAPAPAAPAAGAQQLPPVMAASAPVTLTIPSISVRTDLIHLGLEDNGSLKVPEDTGNGAPASWYDGSPNPVERGPSVLLGHLNALGGNKGVLADLRKLTSGAETPSPEPMAAPPCSPLTAVRSTPKTSSPPLRFTATPRQPSCG